MKIYPKKMAQNFVGIFALSLCLALLMTDAPPQYPLKSFVENPCIYCPECCAEQIEIERLISESAEMDSLRVIDTLKTSETPKLR